MLKELIIKQYGYNKALRNHEEIIKFKSWVILTVKIFKKSSLNLM